MCPMRSTKKKEVNWCRYIFDFRSIDRLAGIAVNELKEDSYSHRNHRYSNACLTCGSLVAHAELKIKYLLKYVGLLNIHCQC